MKHLKHLIILTTLLISLINTCFAADALPLSAAGSILAQKDATLKDANVWVFPTSPLHAVKQ